MSAVGGTDVGGLVGINFGTISGSTASDKVVNNDHGSSTAGLVGYNAGAHDLLERRRGRVYVGDDVHFTGGLVGYNDGAISHDSATGCHRPVRHLHRRSGRLQRRGRARSAVTSPARS